MPQLADQPLLGFQLWVNLPAAQKMMPPRYRDVTREQIPEVRPEEGVVIGIVSGEIGRVRGPVQDLVVETEYLDVRLGPRVSWRHPIPGDHRALAYVFEGSGFFDPQAGHSVGRDYLVDWGEGDGISVEAGESGARFLLISGKPLNEPVAWRGPIVMNTEAELEQAFREYREGTFIKSQQARRSA
jgi:redox-sensitive bicupin YhaK (pirin superfamily)